MCCVGCDLGITEGVCNMRHYRNTLAQTVGEEYQLVVIECVDINGNMKRYVKGKEW